MFRQLKDLTEVLYEAPSKSRAASLISWAVEWLILCSFCEFLYVNAEIMP